MEKNSTQTTDLFTSLTTIKEIHIIIILAIVVFFNCLFNGFVWDDIVFITRNPDVQQLNIVNVFQNTTSVESEVGIYRPLGRLYLMIVYALFNTTPFFYHFTQLIFHCINCVLIYLLFKKYINKQIALLLTLVFLIHPMNVESVSYIAGYASPLTFLLGISALLLSHKEKIPLKQFIIIYGLLLTGLLIKETEIIFVFIVLAYAALFRRKYLPQFFWGTVGVGCIYALLRFTHAQVFLSPIKFMPFSSVSLGERMLSVPAIFFYYLKTFFFPAQLAIDQQWIITKITGPDFYLPLFFDVLFFVLIIGLSLLVYKKQQQRFLLFIFFFLWFLSGMALYMQIFPLDGTVADRWFYVPMAGLLGMAGIILQSFKCFNDQRRTVAALMIVIISVLSIRTMVRNTNFQEEYTLFSHDIQVSNNFDMENNMGRLETERQNYDAAIEHFKNSNQMKPEGADINLYNIGYIYEQKQEPQQAVRYYAQALAAPINNNILALVRKRRIIYFTHLSRLLLLYDSPGTAIKVIKQGLSEYPDNQQLWIYLAVGEYKLHEQKAAITAAEKAKSIESNAKSEYLYNQLINSQPVEFQ